MIASWSGLRDALHKHWRPLAFGLVAVLVISGLFWLDSALSNSQFTEVFVAESPEQEAPTTPTESEPPVQQQLEAAREQARELIEQERQLVEQASNSTDVIRTEIEAVLNQWVTAWSSKDIGTYLSLYSENFDTPFNITREEWAGSRIRRIEEPRWIRVQLEQVDFVLFEEDSAAISVTQLYATPGYADRTRKHIDLVREERGWRILREDSVETVRLDQQ